MTSTSQFGYLHDDPMDAVKPVSRLFSAVAAARINTANGSTNILTSTTFAGAHNTTGTGDTTLITFPPAADVKGQTCRITSTVAEILNIDGGGNNTIFHNGISYGQVNIPATEVFSTFEFHSDGTNYYVVSQESQTSSATGTYGA